MHTPVNLIIPLNACRNHTYLYDISKIPAHPTAEDYVKGVRAGFNVDFEFKEHPTAHTLLDQKASPRQVVTGQISGILGTPAKIFVHPDHVAYARATNRLHLLRHDIMESDALFIDYCRWLGEDIAIRPWDRPASAPKLPPFQVDYYAFFALAENSLVFRGQYNEELRQLAVQGCLTQNRRLTSRDIVGPDDWQLDYVRVGAIVTWNGVDYALRLRWIDVGALHGVASYRDLLINTGQPVDDKDLMKELSRMNHNDELYLIEHMDETYFLYPGEFDRYALGDLNIYKSLKLNYEKFEEMHQELDIEKYFQAPYLTIGRTIAGMLEGKVFQQFAVDPEDAAWKKDTLKHACYPGTAEYFRVRTIKTSAVLAKVAGGRVGAHRMTLSTHHGVWVDLDLGGCYANGLRNLSYAFGRPFVLEYEYGSDINAYLTIRQFTEKYGHDLVPGLWLAYVSLPPDYTLTYPQTFFPSYFGFNAQRKMTIPPPQEGIWNVQDDVCEFGLDTGNVKVFTHRIDYAPLGQNGLEWILYACDAQQRDELLDNLHVITAAYYKRSTRLPDLIPGEPNIAGLKDAWANHAGRNTCEDVLAPDANGNPIPTHRTDNQECYAWTSIGLDKLIVDSLLGNRQLYPKKTALNTLYKIGANGLFGDLVSPHFPIGNVIVGGNVTEQGRSACWYMSGSFNGAQDITDGTQLDLNAVTYRKIGGQTSLTMRDVYPLRFEHNLHENRITLKPLAGYDRFALDSYPDKKILHRWKDGVDDPLTDTVLDATTNPPTWSHTIDDWLNPTLMTHMQDSWDSRISVLHKATTKLIVLNKGSQHGPPQLDYLPQKGVFEFEMKDVYTDVVFHGAANHLLVNAHDPVLKARSYHRTRRYDAYRLEHGILVACDRYNIHNPPLVFYSDVLKNPHAVPRGDAFAHLKIIKPDAFRKLWKTLFQYTTLSPGDSYCVPGLLREWSQSEYRCQHAKQWQDIERECQRSRNRFGQYVECFFVNTDRQRTLDYQRMILATQEALEAMQPDDEGKYSLIKYFDPHGNFTRDGGQRMHPAFPTLQLMKKKLFAVYHGEVEENDFELIEEDEPLYTLSFGPED